MPPRVREGTGIYVGRSPLPGSGVRIRLPALRTTEHPMRSQVMPHQEAPKVLELLSAQLATLTVVQLLPTPLPSGNHISLIILTAGHLGCQQTISSPGSLPYFKPSSPLVLTITVTLDSPLCLWAPCRLSPCSCQNNLLKCQSDHDIMLSIRASIFCEIKPSLTAEPQGLSGSPG